MQTITTGDSITYDPETDTYRLFYDWWRDKTLSTAVSMGIAVVTNTSPTELDPLYESVDTDALNQLFRPIGESPQRSRGRVTFPFHECIVTAYSDGTIEITPRDEDGPTDSSDHQFTKRP